MPLLFDMPYDQLPTYEGTNPRPEDFDDFWDRSLAENEGTEAELIPADFSTSFADCYTSTFPEPGVLGCTPSSFAPNKHLDRSRRC
jgi:cephalosporin-C deacetylase